MAELTRYSNVDTIKLPLFVSMVYYSLAILHMLLHAITLEKEV